MRSLSLIFIISATVLCSSAYSQTCLSDSATLKTRVEKNPGAVLYLLGDTMALSPGCIAELMEAAIHAAKPDSKTLTQMIRLAVTEYPEDAGGIAQAAVMAAPDQLMIIQQAFRTGGNSHSLRKVAKPPKNLKGEPIEKFYHRYHSAQPYDETDIAQQALKAIDELIDQLASMDSDGEDMPLLAAQPVLERVGGVEPKIEEFKLSAADHQVAVSTLNDPAHHDQSDEFLREAPKQPLKFKDPISDWNLAAYLAKQKAEVDQKVEVVEPEPVKPALFSSVYHIPSDTETATTSATSGLSRRSVSPTMPRLREDF